jgi:hypothetical protein
VWCGKTASDGRTRQHRGYAITQVFRKRIEEVLGWIQAAGRLRQSEGARMQKAEAAFTFAVAAYNLIRLPTVLARARA